MSSRWRRFEVLLPLQLNDGRDVPPELLGDAVLEAVDQFGAASLENARVLGTWRHGGTTYRDTLSRLTIDVPDTAANRRWMKAFKTRWKAKLDQLDLWMVSYLVTVE
jgi:hypothetical protein